MKSNSNVEESHDFRHKSPENLSEELKFISNVKLLVIFLKYLLYFCLNIFEIFKAVFFLLFSSAGYYVNVNCCLYLCHLIVGI